jgi:hypothetical protein
MTEAAAPPVRSGGALRAALGLVLVAASAGAVSEEAISAFAASVGLRTGSADTASPTTLYVVPEGYTLLVTDILVANHGQEVGPLYLSDSRHTRCAVELLQTTLLNGAAGGFSTLSNVHTTFSTGIPFGPGEPVVATLAGGSRGVDVTLTGKLVPASRTRRALVLPGGARDAAAEGARRPPGGGD